MIKYSLRASTRYCFNIRNWIYNGIINLCIRTTKNKIIPEVDLLSFGFEFQSTSHMALIVKG